MKKSLLLLLILIICFSAKAQQRCFEAHNRNGSTTKFCVGERIAFFDCAGVDLDKEYYDYDHRDGIEFNTPQAAQKYHTYTTPGKVIVSQLANLNGDTDTLQIEFEVVATPQPNFSVVRCSNKTFILNITDNTYDTYSVKFSDGSGVAFSKVITKTDVGKPVNYTFTRAGHYEISVKGNYTGATCESAILSEIYPDVSAYTPPVITNLKVQQQHTNTGTIDFTFSNLQQGYTYTLTRKLESETNFSQVAPIAANQLVYTLANINTATKAEFRLEAKDACGTVMPASNIIRNIVLNVTANEGLNTVQWQQTGTFQKVEIYRDGSLLSATNPTSPYTDRDIVCSREYCYEIKGLTTDGSIVSTSAKKCVTASATLRPPVGTLLATYNMANQVELKFTAPPGETVQEIQYYKGVNGTTPVHFTTVFNTSAYIDKVSKPEAVCYSAIYKNECALSEMSQIACPILLSGQQIADATYTLNWTSYQGFKEGNSAYTVEFLDENKQLAGSDNGISNTYTHTVDDNSQVVGYRIKATSNNGIITYSNIVVFEQEVQLHIPSAFTPNGDGLNDQFEIKGKRFQEFSIRIMNSTGYELYTSTDRTKSWDGTFKGNPQPAGVYAYVVTVKLQNGTTKRRTGTVTLLR